MRCQECNYDLKGIDSDRCPECGAGTFLVRLLRPDAAFETLVRVLGVWFAAMALITGGRLGFDAFLKPNTAASGSMIMANTLPALVIGVYLIFFAPQIRRLCFRNAKPGGYTSRAVFHLVVGLVGVWLAGRGLAEILRIVVIEVLATRPRVSFVKVFGYMPRFVVGSALVVCAGWLSRIWRAG